MITVVLPAHLRTLAKVNGDVKLDVHGVVTQRSILDALEVQYPTLSGTIRDHVTKQRRAFVRFFACQQDLSHESPDAPLPDAVASGAEPFLVVGAIAGGQSRMNPKSRVWAGRIMTGLTILFLLMDAVMKILKLQIAVVGTVDLGYPESEVAGIGAVLLGCLLLYAIPKTSILGAILLTGYLGGAVATHLRIGSPLVGFVLFPVYVGVMLWGGLFLRDSRVRALFSLA